MLGVALDVRSRQASGREAEEYGQRKESVGEAYREFIQTAGAKVHSADGSGCGKGAVVYIGADIALLPMGCRGERGLHGLLGWSMNPQDASKPHGGVQDSHQPMSGDVWRATQGAATQTGWPGARTEPSCSRLSNHARGMTSTISSVVIGLRSGVVCGCGRVPQVVWPRLWWRDLGESWSTYKRNLEIIREDTHDILIH